MPFTVGFVCTGNIHRSAAAERLFMAAIPDAPPIATWSGGTSGVVDVPMDPDTADAVRAFGGDATGHVSRAIEAAIVVSSDLVLCATTAHRAQLLQRSPTMLRRAFTIREFVRLGASLPASAAIELATEDQLRQRVMQVAGRRGQSGPGEPGADDIADPHLQGGDVIRACVAEVNQCVVNVVRVLGCG